MTATSKKAFFIPYGKQSIDKDDIEAVKKVLGSDWITRGPKVQEFETAVAEYCGAEHAVAFNSGTAALQAAFHAIKLSPYDRIVSSPNSFVASVIGRQRGASVEFTDIDRSTGNMDLESLADSMKTTTTRGKTVVVPIHFAGIPMDMEEVELCVSDPDTCIIEDAAHALGASYSDGSKVGCCAFSAMTIFSFHPVKSITCGEGGMVTTNDEELAKRLRRFRNNGMERETLESSSPGPWYYEVQELTGNYHMSDIHAALGISQLARLDDLVKKRKKYVSAYRKVLGEIEGLQLFDGELDGQSAHHLFVAQIDFEKFEVTRAELMEKLREEGIGTQVHYIPLYRHPVLRDLTRMNWEETHPEMEAYYAEALSLPLYPDMKPKDVQKVVKSLKSLLGISEQES